jgi:hypothetical protein
MTRAPPHMSRLGRFFSQLAGGLALASLACMFVNWHLFYADLRGDGLAGVLATAVQEMTYNFMVAFIALLFGIGALLGGQYWNND